MAESTKIEWADSTFSPWLGCTKISPGCDKCYAERETHGKGWGNEPRQRTTAGYWKQPRYWDVDAPRFERQHGHRRRVFSSHISDAFDNQALPEWRDDLFKLIDDTPRLDWLLLTKRPQNIPWMLPPDWGDRSYPNVWLGISAEDAHHYVQRWRILAAIPAVLRFVSYEPALGPLGPIDIGVGLPDWVIVGGETGEQPRVMNPQWARDVRAACARLGIAFFMKQMTARRPIPADLMIREFPDDPARSGANK